VFHHDLAPSSHSLRRAPGWRRLQSGLQRPLESAAHLRPIVWVLRGQLLVLVIAVFAGALGYMRLARLLGGEVLTSSYVALVAYAGVRVGERLVAYALRVDPLCNLFIVQRHRPLVQRRLARALHWLSVGAWAYVTLGALGVLPSIWSAADAILSVRYVRGSVSLSVGDVAAFALTVWIALVGSSFVRFVLNEELYPRVRLPRGSSYALSTIVHYVIVVTGFVFALAALGVDLTRVTILAGALGVGVGIGLQNVVANFVSGLVLLLERRLHVGDAVQLDNLEGRIREIGGRATTIRTWDGAEVIVPNAVLTSERVTNWTLSDALRRVNLDVGVAYTADPPRVLEILRRVATSHPKALADPAPLALCTGFGDSALKLQLRVWTRIEDAEAFLSELAIGVHRASLRFASWVVLFISITTPFSSRITAMFSLSFSGMVVLNASSPGRRRRRLVIFDVHVAGAVVTR
jgi:potassium-dependent mechanosensitive channel